MQTSDQAAVVQLMRSAFQAYNAGDRDLFLSTWDDEVDAIINEGSPFVWSGPRAVERWLEDSDRELARNDVSGFQIELVDALKVSVAEDKASLLLKVRSNFVIAGDPIVIDGYQIVALTKTAQGWRQKAFAYSNAS